MQEHLNMIIKVGSASDGYRVKLKVARHNATNYLMNLLNHTNAKFSTFDNDQDESSENCAAVKGAGWWYAGKDCGPVSMIEVN